MLAQKKSDFQIFLTKPVLGMDLSVEHEGRKIAPSSEAKALDILTIVILFSLWFATVTCLISHPLATLLRVWSFLLGFACAASTMFANSHYSITLGPLSLLIEAFLRQACWRVCCFWCETVPNFRLTDSRLSLLVMIIRNFLYLLVQWSRQRLRLRFAAKTTNSVFASLEMIFA